MSTTNVVQMQSQFGKTPPRSRRGKSKANGWSVDCEPFKHIKVADAVWVGQPASEFLKREERVSSYVIVTHTTPTRVVADLPDASGAMQKKTWYRDGSQMGFGYGNHLLRVATIPEIVEWEIARAEERRLSEAVEQKQKDEEQKQGAEEEALRSLVPEGIGVLNYLGDKYMLNRLSRKQVEVAGAALKAIVN